MDFWQQTREQASRLLRRAGVEAERATTLARLTIEAGNARGDVQRKTTELGTLARKLVQDGALTHADLSAVITEIEALEARVKELEEQIAATKAGPTRPK